MLKSAKIQEKWPELARNLISMLLSTKKLWAEILSIINTLHICPHIQFWPWTGWHAIRTFAGPMGSH